MAGEKKFGTSLFGFKRANVNAYIELVIREFEKRLKNKDEENADLKRELSDLQEKYNQLFQSAEYLVKEKEKIAGVLLQAQEKAEAMMLEAQDKALKEKVRLDQTLESEKEKIVDIKRDLKSLKAHVTDILTKYEEELDDSVLNVTEHEELYAAASLYQDDSDDTDDTRNTNDAYNTYNTYNTGGSGNSYDNNSSMESPA